MKAARGLEMSQAQKVRVVLGGLHPTVTPFVEQSQPATVDELLRCPAAITGMSAPTTTTEQITSVASLIEKRLAEWMNDVMAYATHDGGPTGQESGRAEREPSHDPSWGLRSGKPRATKLRRTACTHQYSPA